jgi:signal transduction histidine kinase
VQQAIPGSRRDLTFDIAAVLTALAIGLATVLSAPPLLRPLGGLTIAGQILLALCLVFRRTAPATVLLVTLAATAATALVERVAPGTLVPGSLGRTAMPWVPPAVPFAVYAAVAYSRRRPLVWVSIIAAAALATHWWDAPPNSPWTLQGLMLVGGPSLLGMYVGARRRALTALTERAERAEREQHLLAEQARADERARLAAEMHDVVTHRVTLMVLQAGALRVRAEDETTRTAAEELRVTGCQALEELRDVIGLLRRTAEGGDDEDPADVTPLPGLAGLIAESESVGLPVDLDAAPVKVSPVVGRTAYRIVQEALTNVRKHAPGARITVCVRHRPAGVLIAVRNTRPARAPDDALAAAGSGTGLAGLRERVALIGGTLRAGPAGDGGFEVEATLPSYVPEPVR